MIAAACLHLAGGRPQRFQEAIDAVPQGLGPLVDDVLSAARAVLADDTRETRARLRKTVDALSEVLVWRRDIGRQARKDKLRHFTGAAKRRKR
ncbi:hypothetical protein Y958_11545 [Nitrospirillum viridazoti CBAmc]|uniref:Uncharacterized protein n=1 Tax=Nitrospirillum viridazoti CBAmc TaxID=1441467 RepID=A0A248JSA1_9PROT|nr:hypothetical protein Y958_11545 [Nitrospirillum amazonense CBAmc]